MVISCVLSEQSMTMYVAADEPTSVPLSKIILDRDVVAINLRNVINYLEIMAAFSEHRLFMLTFDNCNVVEIPGKYYGIAVRNNTTRFITKSHNHVIMDGATIVNSDLWPADIPKIDHCNVLEYVSQHRHCFDFGNSNVKINDDRIEIDPA